MNEVIAQIAALKQFVTNTAKTMFALNERAQRIGEAVELISRNPNHYPADFVRNYGSRAACSTHSVAAGSQQQMELFTI